MTTTTNIPKSQYNGDGSTTLFAIGFSFEADADILVVLTDSDGADTTWTLGSEYSISGNDIVATTAPANGEVLTILSDADYSQTYDPENGDSFSADVVENALDRLSIQTKQNKEFLNRAVLLAQTTTFAGTLTFPEPGDNAGRIIRINQDGDDLEAVTAGTPPTILVQASEPATTFAENSLWIDSDSSLNDVFQLQSGVWVDTGIDLKGDTGITGAAGGIAFTFSTTTTMADPGAGFVRLNDATLASVTAIAVDDSSAETGNPDVSAWILSFDDSTNSTSKGQLTIKDNNAQENFAIYSVTSLTDNAGWTELTVTHVASSGTLANNADISLEYARVGDEGSITAGSVGTAELADNAVTFAKIQDISTDVLIGRDTAASGDPEEISVTGGLEFTGGAGIQIADLGVTEAKINTGAVTNAKIGASAVDSAEITAGAIDTVHLGDLQVTTAKLAAGAVTNPKVGASAITSSNIATNAIQFTHFDPDIIGDAADRGSFTSGDKLLIQETGIGLRKIDFDDLPGKGTVIETVLGGSGTTRTFTFPDDTVEIIISIGTISFSGTDNLFLRLGDSGGVETTGYDSTHSTMTNGVSPSVSAFTTAFLITGSGGSAASNLSAQIHLTLINPSSNFWVCSGRSHTSGTAALGYQVGTKALSGPLTSIELSGQTGDSFDNGNLNVMYRTAT